MTSCGGVWSFEGKTTINMFSAKETGQTVHIPELGRRSWSNWQKQPRERTHNRQSLKSVFSLFALCFVDCVRVGEGEESEQKRKWFESVCVFESIGVCVCFRENKRECMCVCQCVMSRQVSCITSDTSLPNHFLASKVDVSCRPDSVCERVREHSRTIFQELKIL